jgi:DNA-binding NarL/FixJ family response regulator
MAEVIGGVEDGVSLIDASLRLKPDIVVTDTSLPVLSGLDAAHELSKHVHPPKTIFVTLHEEPDVIAKAFHAGASGYVLKTTLVTDLPRAIIEATQGRVYISPLRKDSQKH